MMEGRRIRIFMVALMVAVLLLEGCGKEGEWKSPKQIADGQVEVIMTGIKEKDPAIIMEQFCSYAKEQHSDLEGEIEEWIDFVDGEIVSYDITHSGRGGWNSEEMRGVTVESIESRVEFKTSTGKTYIFRHNAYNIYLDHPEYVGIVSIGLLDKDMYDPEKEDYPDEAVCFIDA
ncbi:MAG: DUF5104 domain-containing protein [Muribaculaceae bacterium]|nr:DUF5104 domain-containing protein [Roseburia sp.]MCM1430650.1 DUF5104 domain-containing protein [Muribaculaceae bacterium]MCM1491917.1 DUF5104 domain-containing protein [Muribaculaceae bacterium]